MILCVFCVHKYDPRADYMENPKPIYCTIVLYVSTSRYINRKFGTLRQCWNERKNNIWVLVTWTNITIILSIIYNVIAFFLTIDACTIVQYSIQLFNIAENIIYSSGAILLPIAECYFFHKLQKWCIIICNVIWFISFNQTIKTSYDIIFY